MHHDFDSDSSEPTQSANSPKGPPSETADTMIPCLTRWGEVMSNQIIEVGGDT